MSDEQLMIGFDLSGAGLGVLEVLCDEASDEEVFHDIYRANMARPEVLRLLYNHDETPEDLMKEIAGVLQVEPREVRKKPPKAEKAQKTAEEETEELEQQKQKTETLLTKISKLNVGERVALAMKGGKEIRSILLKDSSKEVVKKVLENPKITDSEIDMLTKSRTVTEEALRMVSKKKEWMKNYSIMTGLVNNPKTPAGVAMPFVKFLKKRDLVMLEKNKNVASAVRAAAQKLVKQKMS